MFPGPTLTVDLAGIVANWNLLREKFAGRECAAVVKADAYGMGMEPVAVELAHAGCDTFFVAALDEAIALRAVLPDARILVFSGVQQGEEFAYRQHRIIPVLNSVEQIARWKPVAKEFADAVSAIHIDTGMGRLGLYPLQFEKLLKEQPDLLRDCRVGLIMTHMACAPTPDHPMNGEQLNWFSHARNLAPEIPASLCNSGAIFLHKSYHFDLARPGCSLYGIAPQMGVENPMKQVATWNAPIIELHQLERDQSVGYGATQNLPKGTRLATVASGYADGYFVQLTGKAYGYAGEHKVPLVGRVTMDMLCFDVSKVPESALSEGGMITLLGDKDGIRVDQLAEAAGTIGYDVLTRIGLRVRREYV